MLHPLRSRPLSTDAREHLDPPNWLRGAPSDRCSLRRRDDHQWRTTDKRRRQRQAQSKPIAEALKASARQTAPKLSGRSELAAAFRYLLARWLALTRCFDDGRLSLDNNPAERALRGVAIGRKNYLFAGSDRGGERAAAMYSLIETAKLNSIDP
jgi:transposase